MNHMKTREDIESRIRKLAALSARTDAVRPGHPLTRELEYDIAALRWVLGEMDEDMMGALIEVVPGGREKYDPPAGQERA